MSDNDGKTQTDYFDFEISANGKIDGAINASVYINEVSNNIGNENIKMYLTKLNDNTEEEVFAPTIVSDFKKYEKEENAFIINTKKYEFNSSEKTSYLDKYRLRVWLKEGVDLSSSYTTKEEADGSITSETTSSTYSFKVNVYSKGIRRINENSIMKAREGQNSTEKLWNYNITKIIFQDELKPIEGAIESWDLSEKDKGGVMGYLVDDPDVNGYIAYIQGNGGVYAPVNSSNLFSSFISLKSIEGIEYFNTSKVTNMSRMFSSTIGLTSIDVSHFDTSNVTDMSWMFSGYGLTNLDLSSFDTSNVTSMAGMFSGASSLTSLDLSSFDTSNVTNMSYMFIEASSLTSLDLSSFDTSKVTDMSYMFRYATSLTSLNLSSFNTSNVTSMAGMFRGSSSLTSLDLSSFDTSNVTNMDLMFFSTELLMSLDFRKATFNSVVEIDEMFTGACPEISIIVKDEEAMGFIKNCLAYSGIEESATVTPVG